MALYDDPPHSCATYTVTSGADTGGGVALTYALAQSGVACSINTASASTVEMYAQAQVTVTHTVAFLSSVLTTPITRGMKLIAGDSGGSFHVEGIRAGRQYSGVPAFTYCDCRELL
jgi:hypothetical protein